MTPLHLACKYGHSSMVDILLDNNATVDLTKQSLKTPFYLAAKNGHADVVDVLLRRGICDFVALEYDGTPLHVAVKNRNTEVVEVILKHSCRMFGKLTKEEQKVKENAENSTEKRGIMPIELMQLDGRKLSAGIVWIEECTPLETMRIGLPLGDTALDIAVRSIQPKMVKILLSADRYPYSEQHLGDSFRCMINKITEMDERYKHLSELKSRNIIDVMEVLCYDISLQHETQCKNITEIARVLVNSGKLNVSYQDQHLNTLLHEVIEQCENCSCEYLAKNSRSGLLQIQTLNDVMQLLLEKGADINAKNGSGKTPLIIASERGCLHTIQKLFDWEQKSVLKLDLDARDEYGATALIKAAESHHASMMRLLLSHKVSVNLHDYYGFTALHAAVYEPNRKWFDLHFFCKWLLKRKLKHEDYLEIKWRKKTVDPSETIEILKFILHYDKKTSEIKEEMVKLLLAKDELNVNAIDFRGSTPLDLAVKSCKRLTSETFKALKDRGAIRNSREDKASILKAGIDERCRGPLHRLIIFQVSNYAIENRPMKAAKRILDNERFDQMVHGILLKPEHFIQSATATDDKGRIPLHYAVMPPDSYSRSWNDFVLGLAIVLLEIGSNVNAVDRYGKTPLHYAEMNCRYELLIEHGADESTQDNHGHTPRDLRQIRESVILNTDNAKKLTIGKKALYTPADIELMLNANHVTELSKRKLPVAIQIYSQSSRSNESSQEAIWKVWIKNDFLSLNRRVSKLKPVIQRFIDRLADGIKEKDERFECKPILVGSADEETKAVISADFDFHFRLIKFIQLCDVFPHPLGPKGYFQLRRKCDISKGNTSGGKFDCFFNVDQCLLTNEVNSRFQIVLEDVLYDPNFWQEEHLFEWFLTDQGSNAYGNPARMCKTVRLRMINPIEDGEGGFLFVNISIDVVACVHLEDSCIEDQLAFDINPAGKADDCSLVFGQPRFDPSRPLKPHSVFSDTFARISFAPVESRIIRESSSLVKAAYIVCKFLLFKEPKTTYQLKTSLLFCMEALRNQDLVGCERKVEDKITPTELAFWVERLLFCLMEFYQHDVYPCYFMLSFKQRVAEQDYFLRHFELDDEDTSVGSMIPFKYSAIFDIYLDLCPDDTMINIPIIQDKNTYDLNEGSLIMSQDPTWKQFDRVKFIRKLALRTPT